MAELLQQLGRARIEGLMVTRDRFVQLAGKPFGEVGRLEQIAGDDDGIRWSWPFIGPGGSQPLIELLLTVLDRTLERAMTGIRVGSHRPPEIVALDLQGRDPALKKFPLGLEAIADVLDSGDPFVEALSHRLTLLLAGSFLVGPGRSSGGAPPARQTRPSVSGSLLSDQVLRRRPGGCRPVGRCASQRGNRALLSGRGYHAV